MPKLQKAYLRGVTLKPLSEDDTGYPFNLPAVKHIERLNFHPNITFFVGENGSGKSTVLEALAIALGFGPEGGNKNSQFSTTQDHPSVSPLHEHIRLIRNTALPPDGYFLRAESFFNVATYVDGVGVTDSYGGSLHTRSHGEAFMVLLTHKLRGNGLYLFDELEAALSPARQLAALSALHALVQKNSQLIIATHSPILLAYPHAKIYQFDEAGIAEVAYEETEHFRLSRDFLNHAPKRIEQLLAQ